MTGDPRYQRRGYAPRPSNVPNGGEYGMPPPHAYNQANLYGHGPQDASGAYNYRGVAYRAPDVGLGVGYHPNAMGPVYDAGVMDASTYGGHDAGAMYAGGMIRNMGGMPTHDAYMGPVSMYGGSGMPRGYPAPGRVGMHGFERPDGRSGPGPYYGAVSDRNGYGRAPHRGRGRGRGRVGDRDQGRHAGDVVCCYFLRGVCHHGPRCCFPHEDRGQPCRFGSYCRHGHEQRGNSGDATATETAGAPTSVCPETSNDPVASGQTSREQVSSAVTEASA